MKDWLFCVDIYSNLSERLKGRQTNNHAEIYVSKHTKSIILYLCSCWRGVCMYHAASVFLNCLDTEGF